MLNSLINWFSRDKVLNHPKNEVPNHPKYLGISNTDKPEPLCEVFVENMPLSREIRIAVSNGVAQEWIEKTCPQFGVLKSYRDSIYDYKLSINMCYKVSDIVDYLSDYQTTEYIEYEE